MRLRVGICCVAMLCVAGCSWLLPAKPDPSRFFVLTPVGESSPSSAPLTLGTGGGPPLVGLGPVKLPAYLERPEVVTRVAPNRLDLSNRDRWAEPVDKDFTRILAQDLASQLASGQVITYPWYRPANIDYQIAVDVARFETDSEGVAHLTAMWQVRDPANGDVLSSGTSNISDSPNPDESPAATLSRALADLSRQLADAARAMPRKPAAAAKS